MKKLDFSKLKPKRWLPRIYVCRDVILIMWAGYELMIPRLFKGE